MKTRSDGSPRCRTLSLIARLLLEDFCGICRRQVSGFHNTVSRNTAFNRLDLWLERNVVALAFSAGDSFVETFVLEQPTMDRLPRVAFVAKREKVWSKLR